MYRELCINEDAVFRERFVCNLVYYARTLTRAFRNIIVGNVICNRASTHTHGYIFHPELY